MGEKRKRHCHFCHEVVERGEGCLTKNRTSIRLYSYQYAKVLVHKKCKKAYEESNTPNPKNDKKQHTKQEQ